MTDVSNQPLMRAGIVAAAGILIGTICQASLTDTSQCRPAFDAGRSAAVSGARQACAASDSRQQPVRVAEPEFMHVVEIAGGPRSASN
jgi:hypothetical protein